MTYTEHLLYKKIEQLESELAIKNEALSAYKTVCQNQQSQIVRDKEYIKAIEYPMLPEVWFDQTVRF